MGTPHSPNPSITEVTPSDILVSYARHSLAGFLPFCRYTVGIFYSPSWQGEYNLGNTKPMESQEVKKNNVVYIYNYESKIRFFSKTPKQPSL